MEPKESGWNLSEEAIASNFPRQNSKSETLASVVHIFCGTVAVCLNLLVLYIAFRFVQIRAKINQVFVISMTSADLCFSLVYILTYPILHQVPLLLCGPYYILLWSCQIGSVIFLLFLNIDKLLSLQMPLHYPVLVGEKCALLQTFLSWLSIFGLAIFYFVGPFFKFREFPENCSDVEVDRIFYTCLTLSFYILPTVISLFISIYIFAIVQRSSRPTPGKNVVKSQKKKRSRLFRQILFVFSSTIWTSCTCLPYRIAYASYSFCAQQTQYNNSTVAIGYGYESEDFCASRQFVTVVKGLLYLLVLSAVGNPLITIATQRAYSSRVKNMIFDFLRKLPLSENLRSRIPASVSRGFSERNHSTLHTHFGEVKSFIRNSAAGSNERITDSSFGGGAKNVPPKAVSVQFNLNENSVTAAKITAGRKRRSSDFV